MWSDVDLAARQVHVRDDVKSEHSDRAITIDPGTVTALEAWRESQLFESLEWAEGWTDSGRVFTREDGRQLRHGAASEHVEVLHRRAGLPPVRFHDLRHGAATSQRGRGGHPGVRAPQVPAGGRVMTRCASNVPASAFSIMETATVPAGGEPAGTVSTQVAEADGNRTRRRRLAPSVGFEDRGGHQAP